jgi:ADP-ribosylglycohydrolase
VSEWLKEPVSKTGKPARVSRVRIPPCPLSHSTVALAGSLLGLCLGDALGAPVESSHHRQAARHAAGLRAGRLPSRSRDSHPFGQYTDDGQLARELLISVRDQGRFDPAAFGVRIAALVEADRLVGGGSGTLGAARRLIEGARWDEAGAPSPYSGNGAAMRVGPLGVLFLENEDFREVIRSQSRVTHHDARCAAGALAIAWCVGRAARPEPPEAGLSLEGAARAASDEDPAVGAAVRAVKDWLGLAPAEAALELRRRRLDPEEADRPWRGISSHVTASVCWALYCALRHPDDYLMAVSTAIWAGGDTDSLAAMTGAIVGARVGVAGLPRAYLARLTDRGDWGADRLESLAVEVVAVLGRG